jgi:hypothetical protein
MVIHPEHSVTVEPHPHSASVVQVENMGRGTYAVLVGGVILSTLLAGMALMRAESTSDRAMLAERQSAMAREDVRIMQIAMANHGISTDEHEQEKGK